MKEGQHPHNAIGNEIGEHRRYLMDQLKAGIPISVAVEQFIFNVSFALRKIVEDVAPKKAEH